MNRDLSNDVRAFQNPENLPIEKLQLSIKDEGVTRSVPALSDFWIEKRSFQHYEEPEVYDEKGVEILGAKDRWLRIINYLNDDFKWLLALPYHKFWSNIIHNSTIVESMTIFLVDSPMFYTIEKFPNDEAMTSAFEKLSRNVLITFARIVTNKESPVEFMEKDFHGKLIYDKYLMTVPIMWDLCQIFGRENDKIVEKILSSAIKLNPLYTEDFRGAVNFLMEVFTNIEHKIEASRSIALEMNFKDIEDVVVHLLDLSTTVEIFLQIYPPAIPLFSTDTFLTKLITIYGSTLPLIYERLEAIGCDDENFINYTETKYFLELARVSLIIVFRAIVFNDIMLILDQPNPSQDQNASQRVDKFLNYLSSVISEKEFFKDYNALYPIETDVGLVSQITLEIDNVKKDFILQSMALLAAGEEMPNTMLNAPCFKNSAPTPSTSNQNAHGIPPDIPQSSKQSDSSSKTSEEKLLELIKEVKDIMNNLGEGFIAKCLEHYNNNPSAVINAILEEALPQDLKDLDPELPYIPPDPMAASASMDAVLGFERLNVFDGDEFDIMTQDSIDMSRVHRGKKKDQYKNLNEMLNDKSFKNEMSSVYDKYGLVNLDYEDEYDDTYDSQDVGPGAADDSLEMDARPFTTPRVLRGPERREKPEEVSEEDEEAPRTSGQHQNGKMNFCENPEILRARAEQRRLSRGGFRGRAQGDVVGRPKGQGNEKDVLINRDKKNTNKSSRANHNRRSGAEWKRRQGMMPS